MKRTIFSLITLVALIVMTLPAVSPAPVSAASGASVDFRQYANEDDEWIGSILQASNSKYYECMSVPQRTILADIPSTPGGVHTFNFKHEATKSGTHAYDLLTAYNQGNDPPLAYDPCGEKMGHTPNYTAICESLHSPAGYSILVEVPDDPFVSKDGSTQDKIDAYEAEFGNRWIKIYGDQPFTGAGLTLSHDVADSGDTGDSFIEYVLTWTSDSSQILIEMAGHLALSGEPGTNPLAWGPGLGASQVSGGPYHFKLGELDGASLGSQDNQIKGADILERVIDARISITESATNKLGDPHTFTIHVEEYGGTSWDDASGETVVPSIASGPAGALITSTGPYITDANGEVQVTVDSDTNAGVLELDATCAVSVGGKIVDVDTNGYGAYDISNEKTWVDARISISPDGTNKLGDPHTFTIHVEENDGTGWDDASGETVVPSIASGPAGALITSTGPYVTDANGEVQVTVDSDTNTGTLELDATCDVSVGGITVNVDTNGYGAWNISNEKTWVDARISISPDATNKLGDPHTFTIHVEENDGTGWDNASGETVVPSIASGPTGALITSTGPYVTDANGEVQVTVDSDTNVGVLELDATCAVSVGGKTVDVDTNGYGAYDISNEKTWVDARISITHSDTNVLGDPHTFTIHVEENDGTGWDDASGETVVPSIASGPAGALITSTGPYITDANGEVQVTVDSDTNTGVLELDATCDVGVGGIIVSVSTAGYGAYIVDNLKTWGNARISITHSATNKLGDPHTFTIHVEENDGTGWDDASGETVVPSIASGPAGALITSTGPYVTDANGEVQVTVDSDTNAGILELDATCDVSVDGITVSVSTAGYGAHAVDNLKTWVDARISITDSDTNILGDPHTFTIHVEENDGTSWDDASGETVVPSIASGPAGALITSTGPYVTDANGEVQVTVDSDTNAGILELDATCAVSVGGITVDVDTNGYGAYDISNEKTWVDARISISPDAINKLGDPHTFTIHVEENDGTGWDDASGETVVPSIASGPTGALITSTGPYITDANGEVQVTVDSDTNTGTLELDATCAVSVGGITVDVDTNGYGAWNISNEKTWVDARISIYQSGVNPVGHPHDFTITVEKYVDESTGWEPAAGVNVTPTHSGVGFITSTGPYVTDGSGQVTVTVNSYVTGTATVHASATVSVGDIDIDVATDGYGAYVVDNTKRWTDGGGYSCSCCDECGLTVDWEGSITSGPLYCSNDKLAVDLLGPSFDLSSNLFLEKGTHAPVVYTTTHYVIVVREVKETPATPENMEALVVFNITPANAEFNKDIFLTLGVPELPSNVLNVTMAYYDDINGAWELMDSQAGGPSGVAELTLSAPINHFSIYGVLAELEPTTPQQPAHFVASGLNIEPTVEKLSVFVTKTGESVAITANVANDGGQADTYSVELKLNGEVVDTKTVTLGAGQSKQVTFTVSELDYGQYEVEVGGLSGEFTTSRTITWWLILVIIVAVGLIIWGVVWGTRRRRSTQLEE